MRAPILPRIVLMPLLVACHPTMIAETGSYSAVQWIGPVGGFAMTGVGAGSWCSLTYASSARVMLRGSTVLSGTPVVVCARAGAAAEATAIPAHNARFAVFTIVSPMLPD